MKYRKKPKDVTEMEEKSAPALPRWAEMTLVMFKIGLFTFGGGWSIVAQIQKEFVEIRGWVTKEELLDIVTIGRSFPGIMVVNIAVMLGYTLGGVPCALLCAFGISLPAFLVMAAVTAFYTAIRENPWVARVMVGVRAAVVPIILSASVNLWKTAIRDKTGLVIAFLAFLLPVLGVSNILVIFLGGGAGLVLQTLRAARAQKREGGSGE